MANLLHPVYPFRRSNARQRRSVARWQPPSGNGKTVPRIARHTRYPAVERRNGHLDSAGRRTGFSGIKEVAGQSRSIDRASCGHDEWQPGPDSHGGTIFGFHCRVYPVCPVDDVACHSIAGMASSCGKSWTHGTALTSRTDPDRPYWATDRLPGLVTVATLDLGEGRIIGFRRRRRLRLPRRTDQAASRMRRPSGIDVRCRNCLQMGT